MSLFHNIEIFALGAAAVIDTALLMALTDRNNRRRVILPLLLLVAGAWLLHVGAAVKALLASSDEVWTVHLHQLAMMAMAFGVLLMPSAMLHGVLRTASGFIDEGKPNWRYAWLYLPLVLIIPALQQLMPTPTLAFAELLADWILPYAGWLMLVNVLAGIRFLSLRNEYRESSTRLFIAVAGWTLLILALYQGAIFFGALRLWPEQQALWLLLVLLSPTVMALVISYFIIRFNFMQLVLAQVIVYGSVVVAAILFHQIFLQELSQALSERYRVDFAIIEGIVLIALVLSVKPLRQRSAEALRYLLGSRVDALRRNTREFALQMSTQIDQAPAAIADWFCDSGAQALDVGKISVYLLAANGSVEQCYGHCTDDIGDNDVISLYTMLKLRQQNWCTVATAATTTIAERLQVFNAAVVVVIEHPHVTGLVLFGPSNQDIYEEQLNALVMVVEQLAITLHSSQLQTSRIAAERRAHQNEKLSTLGLLASSIAHEVKNPLASIRTITTVMAEELDGDSDHARDLRLVIGEVDRLNNTVEQLLRFARPTVNNNKTVLINEVIASILHIMRHLALKNGVKLVNQLPASLPALTAEENPLREIFFNLIVNAIEAAGAGANGQVIVSGERQQDSVVIDVQDNGPGITTEQQATIFEPFVSSKAHGTGLGLYLVTNHLRDLGGRIDCHSTPDTGTCFSVQLPVAAE